MKPTNEGVAMTETKQKTEPQPSTRFRKIVTGGSPMKTAVVILAAILPWCCPHWTAGAEKTEKIRILALEPTPLFPRARTCEPLRQIVRLRLENGGPAVEARVKVAFAGQPAYVEGLGQVGPKESVKEIHAPDIAQPTEIGVELYTKDGSQPVDSRKFIWQPQKKWKLYCVAYSHHDLGYGGYPHRLRTTIRHANITRPLRFCRETDGWDEESRFRFVIETSEPITSFLGSQPSEVAEELGRRLREGRIQLGGLHNTANTEQLGHELMARLFYLSGRHARDLLGAPKSRTAQIDDVIGVTWPLATFCAEAEVPYFFHGSNQSGRCFGRAADEPVFYWQGPSPGSRVLVRSAVYGGYAGDNPGDLSVNRVESIVKNLGAKWPYDALLLQEGTDFQLVTMETANRIHAWNGRWAYPRLICATMDMFFDDIAGQADPAKIKTFAKDVPNQWVDQDATDAWLLGQARRAGEMVPTAEKFSTLAAVLTPGGYPWTDVYQAYHRILTYHEHTDAPSNYRIDKSEGARYYETELEENREMVREAHAFGRRALDGAIARLAAAIRTDADRTVVVFNPLCRTRTDLVRLPAAELAGGSRLIDASSGRQTPCQRLPDGSVSFVAHEVPSLGYKTYSVLPEENKGTVPICRNGPEGASHKRGLSPCFSEDAASMLENRFYRIEFDPATGTIKSIKDKLLDVELVDQAAPHKFNEYLYECYPTEKFDVNEWHRQQSGRLRRTTGPVVQTIAVDAAGRGVAGLRQQVAIYDELRRIDFTLSLDKSPSGRDLREHRKRASAKGKEAAYLALPLAVPEFAIHHELPGAVIEPIRTQFENSCTAHFAVRHFSDISGPRWGVTVSPVESPIVEYDHPRSCPVAHNYGPGGLPTFEKVLEYPKKSSMYLYLLNNMFPTNIRVDQRGPMTFTWSMRSHEGDWRTGKADQFGWDVHNPLLAKVVHDKQAGPLPAGQSSFVGLDAPNVVCTTLKPAEANGPGLILRFVESAGKETRATVWLPFVGSIVSACETSLTEDDHPAKLEVQDGSRLTFSIAPFGVKTLRVVCRPVAVPVTDVQAQALSDMETQLAWRVDAAAMRRLSHFNVYRGTRADFQPTLLNLVQRPATTSCVDRPQLHYGGWINNRLEPQTTYYYRIAAVDRWNNQGPVSPPMAATTLKSAEKNMRPLPVERLSVVHVSDVAPFNYLNLLWRSNCESDIAKYEIYRDTTSQFTPDRSHLAGEVDVQATVKNSHTPVDHRLGEFDHQMYADRAVEPGKTYYYRVCAVDRAGQRGPFSAEANGSTSTDGDFSHVDTHERTFDTRRNP